MLLSLLGFFNVLADDIVKVTGAGYHGATGITGHMPDLVSRENIADGYP